MKALLCLLTLVATACPPAQAQDQYASQSQFGIAPLPAVPYSRTSSLEKALPKLNQEVSLTVNDERTENVLQAIAERAGLELLYAEHPVLARRLTLEFGGVTTLEALYMALRGTGLRLQVVQGGRLALVKHSEPLALRKAAAPVHTVTGAVTSAEDGTPLPGVNVIVKGTTTGTTTGADGTYRLEAPNPSDTLVFSFVGFLSEEAPIDGRSEVDVALAVDNVALDEVVVVGFAEQKKVNLTGAVESVDGAELAKRNVTRTSAALQGVAPGLTVTRNSGQPGEDGGTLRIRGIGTLGNASPLVLVDGVETAIDNVDPDDVENISVLKDAASAAIYGSRAANGVVLITTKRAGRQDMRVSYRSFVSWTRPTDLPEFAGGYEFMTLYNEANRNEGKDAPFPEEFIKAWVTEGPSDRYPRTDWQDVVLESSGLEQDHNLTVSGGTERIRLLGSLSFTDQDGFIANTGFKRYALRLNSDIDVSERVRLAFDVYGSRAERAEPSAGMGEVFYQINRVPPIYAAQYADGSWGPGWNGSNPLAQSVAGGVEDETSNQVLAQLRATYEPFKDASLEVSFAPKYDDDLGHEFNRRIEIYDPATGNLDFAVPQKSSLFMSNWRSLETTLNLLGRYNRDFGWHGISGLVGFQRLTHRADWFNASREGYALPDYEQLNAGSSENMQNSGSASEWALLSYFGRLNYDFKGKYLLEGNLRYDGSSRFAEGRKFGLFPSVSAGWRISAEPFMRSAGFVDDLKLRASWGRLGNQEIGLYPYVATVNFGYNYAFGGAPADGAALAALANQDISWETTEMTNVGLDLSLWAGRLAVTADYYVKNTYDILLRLPIPATMGLTAPFQNAGQVRNVGWDLQLAHRNQVRGVDYGVSLVLSDVRNEVIDLKDTGPYIGGYTIIREGDPINALYGYEATGLFQSEEEVAGHATQFGDVAPGDIKYRDQNGDGVINADDRVVLGNTIPRYTYGLSLDAAYRSFDLSVFLQGIGDANGYLDRDAAWAFHNGGKIQTWQMDYWTPDNPDAAYPRLTFTLPNNKQVSSYWMTDASYLRLKSVVLGYDVPASAFGRLPVSGLRLYVSGQDLFSRDDYRGFDPEAPLGQGSFYPITASYTLGLQLQF